MIYVTSDIHGRFDYFKKLLKKIKFSNKDYLFILGDVIDRHHDGGVSILKWLLVQPNVQLILGNHEAMCLSCEWLFDEIRSEKDLSSLDHAKLKCYMNWRHNGAEPTMKALREETAEVREDIFDYLKDCPLYDTVHVGSRDFVLVHGGLGNFAPDKPLSSYEPFDLLWTRPSLETEYTGLFVILGHTPTSFYGTQYRHRMIKTPTFCNIDTGAAQGYFPMMLRLDDMKPFYLTEADTLPN